MQETTNRAVARVPAPAEPRRAGELVAVGHVQVLRLPGNRATVVGTLDQVAALLTRIRQAGQLVAASDPVPDGRPGVYAVTIRLVPNAVAARPATVAAPAARARRGFWTRQRAGIAAGAAVAVLTLLAWLVYLVVTWIAAHLVPVVVALVALAVLGGLGGPRVCKTIITITHRH